MMTRTRPPEHYNPYPMFGLRTPGDWLIRPAGADWERVILAQASDGSYLWLESNDAVWPKLISPKATT